MAETKDMLENEYGIKQQVISTRNPQANSMVERAHQTLHQLIMSHDIANNPNIDLDDPFQESYQHVPLLCKQLYT